MNTDPTPWEKQLESWTPRAPSARLKHRIFDVPAPAAASGSAAASVQPLRFSWSWLAPATGLLALALSVITWVPRPGSASYAATGSGDSNTLASLLIPSPSAVLYVKPDPSFSTYNVPPSFFRTVLRTNI
jgi:hypothetical protein